MPITRLILVRHGETEWNRAGRMQGHDDSPLTANGRAQAQALAQRLAGMGCTALYHSDLGRARDTAAAVAAATGLVPHADPRLRERLLGAFQGLTRVQIRELHPDAFDAYIAREPDFVIPDGESLHQLSHRVTTCLNALTREAEGGTVVAVTHGGVLDVFHRFVTGTPIHLPRHFSLRNVSINRFHHDGVHWHLETWGDASHLEDLRTMDEF